MLSQYPEISFPLAMFSVSEIGNSLRMANPEIMEGSLTARCPAWPNNASQAMQYTGGRCRANRSKIQERDNVITVHLLQHFKCFASTFPNLKQNLLFILCSIIFLTFACVFEHQKVKKDTEAQRR